MNLNRLHVKTNPGFQVATNLEKETGELHVLIVATGTEQESGALVAGYKLHGEPPRREHTILILDWPELAEPE